MASRRRPYAGKVIGSPRSLTVRRAVPDDAPSVHELSGEAIRRSAATYYSEAQLAAWAARRTLAAHHRMIERTVVFVAVKAGTVVGFASVSLEPEAGLQPGEVDQLFVHPDHGGRGGAGLLLAAVEAAARDAGITELVTHASWRAAPVFGRCGYEEVAPETVTLDDQVLTRMRMRKWLVTTDPPG
jgi:putative acetyltransferase